MRICMCHELLSKIYLHNLRVHVLHPPVVLMMRLVMKDMMQRKRELKNRRNSVLECCVNCRKRSSEQWKLVTMNIITWMITAVSLSWVQLMMMVKKMTSGEMRKPCSFPMFLKSFGRILPSTLFRDNLNFGLTDLRMRLRFNVCLAWEFCKSVVSLKVRSVELSQQGSSTIGDWKHMMVTPACLKVKQNAGCDVADMLQGNLQMTNVMMCIHLQLDVIHQTLCKLSFSRCWNSWSQASWTRKTMVSF